MTRYLQGGMELTWFSVSVKSDLYVASGSELTSHLCRGTEIDGVYSPFSS